MLPFVARLFRDYQNLSGVITYLHFQRKVFALKSVLTKILTIYAFLSLFNVGLFVGNAILLSQNFYSYFK
jgi:hypothetical protein